MSSRQLGADGEDLAVCFLKTNGYQIRERNFRTRVGEVDIIAVDRKVLVFVEVKARKGIGFGVPAEAVTYRKQQQIAKAALAYINRHDLHGWEARFDVVSILFQGAGAPDIQLIKNAFELTYGV